MTELRNYQPLILMFLTLLPVCKFQLYTKVCKGILFQSALFHKGSDKLNSEFKTTLDKYNIPMLPVVLLDLINYEGEFENKFCLFNMLVKVLLL